MGVFSDDFAAVDVREELCYHSRPEKAKFKRCTEERKQNQKRKLCAAAKAAADPQADQRGRLRAAALSRRRKLRFSVGLLSQPARFAPLRLLFPKNLCFANLFREPCFTRFSCHFSVCFSVACAWLRRREAPTHLSMPSTRHGAK